MTSPPVRVNIIHCSNYPHRPSLPTPSHNNHKSSLHRCLKSALLFVKQNQIYSNDYLTSLTKRTADVFLKHLLNQLPRLFSGRLIYRQPSRLPSFLISYKYSLILQKQEKIPKFEYDNPKILNKYTNKGTQLIQN